MTESEAWLKLAEMFDNDTTTGVGLCYTVSDLAIDQIITGRMSRGMHRRLLLFAPRVGAIWFWPSSRNLEIRTLRATACCFLAAMSQ